MLPTECVPAQCSPRRGCSWPAGRALQAGCGRALRRPAGGSVGAVDPAAGEFPGDRDAADSEGDDDGQAHGGEGAVEQGSDDRLGDLELVEGRAKAPKPAMDQ